MEFDQSIREVVEDIQQRLSKSRDTAISMSHVESSWCKNKSVLDIEADLVELFPELEKSSQYNDVPCQEFRLVVEPNRELTDYTDSELQDC